MFRILTLSTILCLFSSPVVAETETEWAETRALGEVIARAVPPANSHYFFVGRGTGPLSIFFGLRADTNASELPLSDFRHDPPAAPGSRPMQYRGLTEYRRPLSPERLQEFFRHLDLHLPSDAQLAGRELVLIDFGHTGVSMVALAAYIELYKAARRRNFTVKKVLLHYSVAHIEGALPFSVTPSHFDHVIDMGAYPTLNRRMEARGYRPISAVGEWLATRDRAGVAANPAPAEHLAYQAGLRRLMERAGITLRASAGCMTLFEPWQ